MNEPNKREPYVCPQCEGDNVECTDYEWDGECMRQEFVCHKCKAQWNEYFTLKWAGYAYKGVDYDEKGEVMPL
jgi:transposase-like protein